MILGQNPSPFFKTCKISVFNSIAQYFEKLLVIRLQRPCQLKKFKPLITPSQSKGSLLHPQKKFQDSLLAWGQAGEEPLI